MTTPRRMQSRLGPQSSVPSPRHDPLGWLAEAAGYSDGERWWEHMVEQRRDGADLFAAILEAMTALREAVAARRPTRVEAQREAWMRQTIRAAADGGLRADRRGLRRLARARRWRDAAGAKADAALLKGLPKIKVQATWVPWTYGRLCLPSGYGAGIESPGWYRPPLDAPPRPTWPCAG